MNEFTPLTKKAFPYAYNILGNIADSQDVIQDVLININQKEQGSIANGDAYLIRSVINRAINLKKKRDKERILRLSLPEPIITNQGEAKIDIDEILNYSMLVLLDALNTKERAVFLLKEAFDYDHAEISEVLGITQDNSRQLLSRAKRKLKGNKPTVMRSSSRNREYLEKYIEAIRSGDTMTLERMLSKEVRVLADGGTKVNVVAQLTWGIGESLKLIIDVYEFYQRDFRIVIDQINHQPALLFYEDDRLMNCQIFEIDDNGKIGNIFSVVDPDKLSMF